MIQIIGRIESAFADPKAGKFQPWNVHPLRERAEYRDQDEPIQINWDVVKAAMHGNRFASD